MFVRVSQDSVDTLPRGSLSLGILGLSYVYQSIPGFRGYFTKGVPITGHPGINPMYVRVYPRIQWILYQGVPITGHPSIILCLSVDTLPRRWMSLGVLR